MDEYYAGLALPESPADHHQASEPTESLEKGHSLVPQHHQRLGKACYKTELPECPCDCVEDSELVDQHHNRLQDCDRILALAVCWQSDGENFEVSEYSHGCHGDFESS